VVVGASSCATLQGHTATHAARASSWKLIACLSGTPLWAR
jgi:hypothetical protein